MTKLLWHQLQFHTALASHPSQLSKTSSSQKKLHIVHQKVTSSSYSVRRTNIFKHVSFYSVLLQVFPNATSIDSITEKTNNSFDKSISSISVLREDNPQKTQSPELLKRNSEGN
jgi:hypothetical protein